MYRKARKKARQNRAGAADDDDASNVPVSHVISAKNVLCVFKITNPRGKTTKKKMFTTEMHLA